MSWWSRDVHAPGGRRRAVRRCAAAAAVLVVAPTACAGSAERVASCPPSPFRAHPPLVVAHAGGEGLGPANTIVAMRRSMAAGADVLDTDLWMTADGVVVAQHDRDLAATTRRPGLIDELSWAEVQRFDVRPGWSGAPIDTPVRIPSLAEILDTFPSVPVSVEIKQTAPSMAAALCTVLRQADAFARVYVSSNFDDALYAAKAECPQMVVTTSYRDVDAMRAARSSGAAWCAPAPIGQPPYSSVRLDAADVRWSHDHGMAVFTWTVDDPDTLRELARGGVDGVYTRRPDIARRVFAELTQFGH